MKEYKDFKLRRLINPVYLYRRAVSLRSLKDLAHRLMELGILFGKLLTGRYGGKYWERQKRLLVENYAKASENNPEDAGLHLELGKKYHDLGILDLAKKEFESAYRLGPDNSELAKWISVMREVAEPRGKIPPYRVFITWGMTYECNFRCSYCYAPKPGEPGFDRDPKYKAEYPGTEKVAQAWDRITENYGGCRIRLDGGEPSLYPDFLNVAKKLSAKHRLQINSNLSFDVGKFSYDIDPARVKFDASFHPEFMRLTEFLGKAKILSKSGFKISSSVVAFPRLIKRLNEYKTAFEKEGLQLVIHPFSGNYTGMSYPERYTAEEKKLIFRCDESSMEEMKWRTNRPQAGLQDSANRNMFWKKDASGGRAALNAFSLMEAGAGAVEESNASINTAKHNSMPPAATGEKYCRMGQMYARIYPNGDAFRCCTDDGLLGLGNIYKGSFKLLDNPAPCCHKGCRCWRSMTINEESRWLKTWIDDWEMPF